MIYGTEISLTPGFCHTFGSRFQPFGRLLNSPDIPTLPYLGNTRCHTLSRTVYITLPCRGNISCVKEDPLLNSPGVTADSPS